MQWTFSYELLFWQKVKWLCTQIAWKKYSLAWNPSEKCFEWYDSTSSISNDQWYRATLWALTLALPVWQAWRFATVWNEPAWPVVFYNRSTISNTWEFNWAINSYLWLTDTTDTTYVWKAWYVPVVNVWETWLTLQTPPVPDLQQVTDVWNTTDNDVEITDTTKWLILTSPSWTRWRVWIDDTWNPTFTSL